MSERVKKMQARDYFDGLNWDKMISEKEFVFFQVCDNMGGWGKVHYMGGYGDGICMLWNALFDMGRVREVGGLMCLCRDWTLPEVTT